MKTRLMILALAGCLLVAGAAMAAVQSAGDFLSQVAQRVDDGRLTADQALLLKFQYAFDRARLPGDLQPEGLAPMKCGTDLVVEYLQREAQLPTDIRQAIEGYLAPPDEPTRDSFISPSGRFTLNYTTVGTNAVPAIDSDGSGVPDYIEHCADYLDYSWQREVIEEGFVGPPIGAGTMSIFFQALSGVYGFTQPSGSPGMTRITLDNDFVGFPPNDDPDGDVLGAAKVTCAHEFKHSTQYAGSNWSEGGWVELDATWAEDLVFDDTNDYYNYLPFGSGISTPAAPLDDGGTGSYEDCIWQHIMSETYGNGLIADMWLYRRTHQSQPMLTTYDNMLATVGSSIENLWPVFTAWNFATGARSSAGFGYGEAATYPSSSVNHQTGSYPNTFTSTVQHLSANFMRCLSLGGHPGELVKVTFNGADGGRFNLAAYMHVAPGNAGAHYLYDLDLDSNNDGVFTLPIDLATMYEVGIIISNTSTAGGGQGFTVTVERATGITPVGDNVKPLFAIDGNHPNPFNPATTIDFSLDRAGAVAIDLYDMRGQRVRSLVSETMPAGAHSVRWDGLDDAGRNVASGTYVARMSSAGQVTTHKLVLTK